MRIFGGILFAGLLAAGCVSSQPPPALKLKVGSYNIRYADGDRGTPNAWDSRKDDLAALVRSMDLDVFGLQEVCPEQAAYLRTALPDYAYVGDHREADRVSGEASPVCYRKSRFEAERSGTFWLSETPEKPGSKSWNTCCTRVCSYAILREKATGRRFCFANTHTDHRSELAREKGMMLIVSRMKEFGRGLPIVFTGDHNCRHDDKPAVEVRRHLNDARDCSEVSDPGPKDTFENFGKPLPGGGGYRIDYIYISPGMRVLDFVTRDDRRPGSGLYPSDHRPITATLSL